MTTQGRARPRGTLRASTDQGVGEGGRKGRKERRCEGRRSICRPEGALGTESDGPMRAAGLDDGWAERLPLPRQPYVGRNSKERPTCTLSRTLWETYLRRASLSLMDGVTRSFYSGTGCWTALIPDYASE